MRLYDKKNNKIVFVDTITARDGRILYVDKIKENFLNENGYYLIKPANETQSDFYNYSEKYKIKDNKCVVGFNKTQKQINEVKELLLSKLKNKFMEATRRPRVQTGLGFDVDGGREDLDNFKNGKDLQLEFVIDADGKQRQITVEDYDTIIRDIQIRGLQLMQQKWQHKAYILDDNRTFDELVSYNIEFV